jgi:hypothetical protein
MYSSSTVRYEDTYTLASVPTKRIAQKTATIEGEKKKKRGKTEKIVVASVPTKRIAQRTAPKIFLSTAGMQEQGLYEEKKEEKEKRTHIYGSMRTQINSSMRTHMSSILQISRSGELFAGMVTIKCYLL